MYHNNAYNKKGMQHKIGALAPLAQATNPPPG